MNKFPYSTLRNTILALILVTQGRALADIPLRAQLQVKMLNTKSSLNVLQPLVKKDFLVKDNENLCDRYDDGKTEQHQYEIFISSPELKDGVHLSYFGHEKKCLLESQYFEAECAAAWMEAGSIVCQDQQKNLAKIPLLKREADVLPIIAFDDLCHRTKQRVSRYSLGGSEISISKSMVGCRVNGEITCQELVVSEERTHLVCLANGGQQYLSFSGKPKSDFMANDSNFSAARSEHMRQLQLKKERAQLRRQKLVNAEEKRKAEGSSKNAAKKSGGGGH